MNNKSKTFKVKVWVSVGLSGCEKSEIVEVNQKDEPTDEEMYEIYKEVIGELMESGFYLLDSDENE